MSIEIKMPALSPTMEEGTLAKWLVKEGDTVKAGDLMAEIETDKATMEFEAVDEGVVAKIVVAEGTDGVKVGDVIMLLNGEGEESAPAAPAQAEAKPEATPEKAQQVDAPVDRETGEKVARDNPEIKPQPQRQAQRAAAQPADGARLKASPLARRIAAEKGVDLGAVAGSGPNGRIVKADVEGAQPGVATSAPKADAAPVASAPAAPAAAQAPAPAAIPDIPHETTKLSNMRKTIARRLTESKQQVPHIYLTVDVRLDKLLKLRSELNDSLAARGVKLSVNDLMIKALAVALVQVPKCNVMYTPNELITFKRADISVAVSTAEGLITPVITEADTSSLSSISTRMKDLAARARDRKLKPEEFQGGTASLSNMGMYGIKQFEAVINPPQGMILAVGAGEKRPYVIDDALGIATVMSATGSFDHRAIDGADGAELMQAFKALCENPLGMLA
ncbi:pyruvate dehydrogenase complex dihydrolipoamide acetyltransferase [Sphingomonas mucosissima]|uniref:Acetyltransferase component of pyruvate dehydrogenase complex n=1 Tax=Sphingomonas mucosissima TaxID=370959 RepID=A0A245ZG31_9SPHN|nr:pyruvate dehydrogenase complex dihydrolipoamide acetyltransferase [Sphingomonas mucosissima]OWK28700.1 dihydrolipoyllysine-residue acetyltransferase component of pyruvate dehydrogenase complex [Sphingomonas mucosissima]